MTQKYERTKKNMKKWEGFGKTETRAKKVEQTPMLYDDIRRKLGKHCKTAGASTSIITATQTFIF